MPHGMSSAMPMKTATGSQSVNVMRPLQLPAAQVRRDRAGCVVAGAAATSRAAARVVPEAVVEVGMLPAPMVTLEGVAHVRFEGVSPQPGDNPDTKQLLRIGAGTAEWEC